MRVSVKTSKLLQHSCELFAQSGFPRNCGFHVKFWVSVKHAAHLFWSFVCSHAQPSFQNKVVERLLARIGEYWLALAALVLRCERS